MPTNIKDLSVILETGNRNQGARAVTPANLVPVAHRSICRRYYDFPAVRAVLNYKFGSY
ncbi:hypothetical protein MKK65_01065 [Methylobacterium sp. J-001]|uniref:hypothetical protein n=1 Tax=Methylobacterium sp. J-001 TaxID=2836609 RepID=UPI001FBA497D|nr:hypothetical protein [Methylobacterium sp. J-001]MCJ2115202.1 hypothetical protein [Methylobacterium sp. J-001]